MALKAKYEPLQKKYNLPSFEQLDREFEISCIESEDSPLREIRKKIDEKIKAMRTLLEEVLQPETNLAGIYESRAFSEDEKKTLFELYRKIMSKERKCVELLIRNDEQADAAFIKSFSAEWETLKKELAKAADKLRDYWENEKEVHEKLGYFG
ncbi:MAG: hypothetical protein V1702_04075 [Candidatus Woesearchaeota archaeon]